MVLTNEQLETFRDALVSAYPDYDKLKQMLFFKLDKELADIVSQKGMKDVAFEVLKTAKAEGWLEYLLEKATQANPNNPELKRFASSLKQDEQMAQKVEDAQSLAELAENEEGKEQLQKRNFETDGFSESSEYHRKGLEMDGKICQVRIDNIAIGTGFLIADDKVLTNYHVVEDVIKGKKQSKDISLLFDFKQEGDKIQSIVVYLATENIKYYSPYSEADKFPRSDKKLPNDEELDYAILFLAQPMQRGFISMPLLDENFGKNYLENTSVTIKQHPLGATLKEATGRVKALNGNNTRVYYDAYTEGGSSGSPCFNRDWELIALHHGMAKEEALNKGIPIYKIIKHWIEKGIDISKPVTTIISSQPQEKTIHSQTPNNNPMETLEQFKERLKAKLDTGNPEALNEVLDEIEGGSFRHDKFTLNNLRNKIVYANDYELSQLKMKISTFISTLYNPI